jgi:glycosyltransferase involved in cell wall biosynthesis
MLSGAIISLVQQSLDAQQYEIIVVDNASTDNTAVLVQSFQAEYTNHNIILLHEARQGLSYARNRAWQQANGKFVAYLDDDAKASAHWLKDALHLFDTVEPTPICLGGPAYPFYTTAKPNWFQDDYEIRSWGSETRFLETGEAFAGLNMIWQKEILEQYGGFDVNLGVIGNHLFLGEESALFKTIWQETNCAIFYYSPALAIQHWVPATKMSVWYKLKRPFVSGQTWHNRYRAKNVGDRLKITGQLLWHSLKMVLVSLIRFKQYAYWQNWLIEEWTPVMRRIGAVFGMWGIIVSLRQR